MSDPNLLDDWKRYGRDDADAGLYDPPFPGERDIHDMQINRAYTDGFRERRRELGKQDNDQCQNA